MDLVNHGVFGFIMGYSVTNCIPVGIISGLTAIYPDIYGEYKARVENDNWEWYIKVHDGKHWLSYIPPVLVHIALDKLCHGEGKRWYAGKWYEYFMPTRYRERMWIETATWILNIVLLGLLIYKNYFA